MRQLLASSKIDVSSSIKLQYGHTIGRNDMFGLGFAEPAAVVRGAGDLLYVVSRNYEFRPEGIRITVCTVGEQYITEFARGVTESGPHQYSYEDGSLVWPTAIALDRQGDVYV